MAFIVTFGYIATSSRGIEAWKEGNFGDVCIYGGLGLILFALSTLATLGYQEVNHAKRGIESDAYQMQKDLITGKIAAADAIDEAAGQYGSGLISKKIEKHAEAEAMRQDAAQMIGTLGSVGNMWSNTNDQLSVTLSKVFPMIFKTPDHARFTISSAYSVLLDILNGIGFSALAAFFGWSFAPPKPAQTTIQKPAQIMNRSKQNALEGHPETAPEEEEIDEDRILELLPAYVEKAFEGQRSDGRLAGKQRINLSDARFNAREAEACHQYLQDHGYIQTDPKKPGSFSRYSKEEILADLESF
jgi:hypothetical protein